jgi:hypothetical protein
LLLARLIQSRKVKRVVSLDLLPPITKSGKLDWKIADVRDPGLERHFEEADALVHLAFVQARRKNADALRSVNIDAAKKMFSHAVGHGLKKIVYASSIAAYGLDRPHPCRSKMRPGARRRGSTSPTIVKSGAWMTRGRAPRLAVVRLRPGYDGRRMVGKSAVRCVEACAEARRRTHPVVWDEDVADALSRCSATSVELSTCPPTIRCPPKSSPAPPGSS